MLRVQKNVSADSEQRLKRSKARENFESIRSNKRPLDGHSSAGSQFLRFEAYDFFLFSLINDFVLAFMSPLYRTVFRL